MGLIEKMAGLIGHRRPAPSVDDILLQAEMLAGNGQKRDAVRYLQRAALDLDDRRLYLAVTGLRHGAAMEAAADARPRVDWPPALPDPFPNSESIPEITRDRLSADVIGGAILHHGSLLIRGLLDREEATALAEQVDRGLDAHDAWHGGQLGDREAAWYSPFPLDGTALEDTRGWMRDGGNMFASDSPATLTRLADFYQRHGLISAIEGYLGERPMLSAGKTVLRRVSPTNAGDFHQDGAFLGSDVRTVNVWIALSDCGKDAPGLEVVDRRLPGIVPTGTADAYFSWSVGRPTALQANEGRQFARPIFAAGDALIFDQLMLHATSFDPSMTRNRWAIEAWFFAPSAYSEEQIPLFV